MESTETYQKPSRRIAAALGFFLQPVGMLYVARPGWAGIYLVLGLVIGTIGFIVLREPPRWAVPAAVLLLATVCAVQAYRYARDFREIKRPWYSRGFGLVFVVAVLAALVMSMRAFFFEPFRAPAGSMAPTIEIGARFIVSKWGYGNYRAYGVHLSRAPISSELTRGDIVVFEYPEDRTLDYVKRIVGLPGDQVAYFSKRLWVNDQEAPRTRIGDYVRKDHVTGTPQYVERLGAREYSVLVEADTPAYVPPPKPFPLIDHCTFTKEGMSCRVPPGQYFVLGDNRDNSIDSRVFGFVPAANIVGKVQFILP